MQFTFKSACHALVRVLISGSVATLCILTSSGITHSVGARPAPGAHGAINAMPFTLVSTQRKSLTAGALAAAQKTATRGVVARDKKSLSFSSKTIRLVAHTGPDKDMLSYRIADLRNPTVSIPRGALLRVLFINTDEDMLHDMHFGAVRPAFPNIPNVRGTVGSIQLPHEVKATFAAQELALRAPITAGTYTYFCSVRGHAQGGMWGKIIVH